jgi:tRNA(Ile)-lysidine synthase
LASLPDRLIQHIRAKHLFPEAGTAVVAVSGGPDSVSLLDLLHGLAGELGLTLVAAHVDHGILPDSAAIALQVSAIAAGYGVPSEVERLRLGPRTSETRARKARYAALRRIQQQVSGRYLVTAHQADDQIETILYRLFRGSGMGGLAAIPARGHGGLVRPLLPFRRAELREWLVTRFPDPQSRPPLFHDPSNADVRHDRSWIRGHVLPLLVERFGARVERDLLALAAHAAREREAWSTLLAQLPELQYRRLDATAAEVSRAGLLACGPALAEAVLRAVARELGSPLGPARSAQLLAFVQSAVSGRRAELGRGMVAEVTFGRLRLGPARRTACPGPVAWGGSGGMEGGQIAWDGWQLRWQPEDAGRTQRGGWITWVTAGVGTIRGLAPGDRLVPLGAEGHRGASRLLMEARVPRGARPSYPVVVRGPEVLWLPGVCRAAADVPGVGEPALRLELSGLPGVGAADIVG